MSPLLTLKTATLLNAAVAAQLSRIECSLDLDRSHGTVEIGPDAWRWAGRTYPYPSRLKDRTIYYWDGERFTAVQRYTRSLIKLVPTEWGAPTFEIDGIKMLPTAQVSPYADADHKVRLIDPKGKRVLDTCGGLGYFAAWCIEYGVREIRSYEKNPDVIWLRSLNPWSPHADPVLQLTQADISVAIAELPAAAFDAALHDPPRFGIAGELYSQAFYDHLARVLKRGGRLFHYTGTPNKITSGRNVPQEVAYRLRKAGFSPQLHGDGILATKSFT